MKKFQTKKKISLKSIKRIQIIKQWRGKSTSENDAMN